MHKLMQQTNQYYIIKLIISTISKFTKSFIFKSFDIFRRQFVIKI